MGLIDRRVAWSDARARTTLRAMFDAAVKAAHPAAVLARHLPERPRGRCVVVGAGKAAAAMAAEIDAAWPDVSLSGTVVTPYGYALPAGRIRVLEAAHPIPDDNSLAAAREMLRIVQGLTPEDLVVALISGGGSAVLCLPAPGLTLADKQAVNRALLESGLDIRTMNMVRRRLSGIKGGKLAAAAAPARIVTLAISDIPGDDPSAIASGPTIADPCASRDLTKVADLLRDQIPKAAYAQLVTPPGPAPIARGDARVVAAPAASLAAAAAAARAEGLDVEILGDALEGESRRLGAWMAGQARPSPERARVLLSGGETTVSHPHAGGGRGGPNTEFALAMALALEFAPGVWALAADTDGEDGASGAAGAIIAPDTLARARAAGLDPAARLAAHDSAGVFRALGDLVVTGPTYTNVNDFRAVLVAPRSGD